VIAPSDGNTVADESAELESNKPDPSSADEAAIWRNFFIESFEINI